MAHRRSALWTLILVACLAPEAAAQSELAGETRVAAAHPGYVDVVVPRDVEGLTIALEGSDGPGMDAVLLQRLDGPGPLVQRGPDGIGMFPPADDLVAGRYRLYVVSQDTSATAVLRAPGLEGRAERRLTHEIDVRSATAGPATSVRFDGELPDRSYLVSTIVGDVGGEAGVFFRCRGTSVPCRYPEGDGPTGGPNAIAFSGRFVDVHRLFAAGARRFTVGGDLAASPGRTLTQRTEWVDLSAAGRPVASNDSAPTPVVVPRSGVRAQRCDPGGRALPLRRSSRRAAVGLAVRRVGGRVREVERSSETVASVCGRELAARTFVVSVVRGRKVVRAWVSRFASGHRVWRIQR
jgi:hypothetical protein